MRLSHNWSMVFFRAFCHQIPLDEYDVMREWKEKEQALLRLRAD